MKIHKLELLVFVAGFAVMVVEICGARLLEPYMGNTLFVWTSSISVILGALGIGYYLGGRLASGMPDPQRLAVFVFAAAVLICLIPFASGAVLGIRSYFGFEYGPLFACAALFALPNVLLGMVSPYAVRLNTTAVKAVGRSAGNLYAISTFGSILGALLSGYVLIPYVGINESFFIAGIMLAIAGIFMFGKKLALAIPIILVIALLPVASPYAGMNVVYSADTPYYNLAVANYSGHLMLLTDTLGVQTVSNSSVAGTYYAYQNILYNKSSNTSALYLGLGGGTMVDYFYKNSTGHIDVVEIDPVVIQVARDYFGLNDSSRVTIYNEDARSFLRDTNSTYDMIVLDTYGSGPTMPPQMVTVEAAEEMKSHLDNGGGVLINVISTLNGTGSCTLKSIYRTFGSVFPHIYIFPLFPNYTGVQNIVLIASESNYSNLYVFRHLNYTGTVGQINWILDGNYNQSLNTTGCSILTDDKNPFEVYSAQTIGEYK